MDPEAQDRAIKTLASTLSACQGDLVRLVNALSSLNNQSLMRVLVACESAAGCETPSARGHDAWSVVLECGADPQWHHHGPVELL